MTLCEGCLVEESLSDSNCGPSEAHRMVCSDKYHESELMAQDVFKAVQGLDSH